MKKVKLFIVTVFVFILTAIILTSCSGSRVGCQQHSGYMGYR
jgi:hypothetical protein